MRRSRAKIRWKQPLLTLAALTLLLAFDGSGILRVGLGCAVLHECGHALAYRLLWQAINEHTKAKDGSPTWRNFPRNLKKH